jgi:hypothetical protein
VHLRSIAVSTLIGVVLATGIASSAQAAGSKIHILKVKFDSDGSDAPITNAKLNDEYVVLKNTDTVTRHLQDWTLVDASRHKYTFGDITIKAGATLKIRTGSGTDTSKTKYQNRGYYIWNNTSDTAKLRNSSGTGGDTCSWKTSDPGSTKTC